MDTSGNPAPLVSILSPTFNHARYIGDCIRSVQGQTFDSWEMIILDDGSTDDTLAIANGFARDDQRIKVYTQLNIGVFRLGETYNKGLNISRGKYIAILEGDDLWVPDKLEKQVAIMESQKDLVLLWGQAELVNEDNSKSYYISPEKRDIPDDLFDNKPSGSIIELAPKGAWLPALTLLIRKDLLLKIGGFLQTDNMPLIDFPTILTLSREGPFYFENRVLGKWRIYASQTTKKYTTEIYNGMYEFLKRHFESLPVLTSEQKEKILGYYKNLCLIAYARSGRYRLIRKEYKNARKDYAQALMYPVSGQWTWRLRALVGFGMSLFHLDVEWLAKLLGKKTYNS